MRPAQKGCSAGTTQGQPTGPQVPLPPPQPRRRVAPLSPGFSRPRTAGAAARATRAAAEPRSQGRRTARGRPP
eukprot:11192392-Lingulodinium_polyedra.AAC.1